MAEEVSAPVGEKPAASARSEKPAAGKMAAPAPNLTRLVSLDAFRGFIMFWIVGGGGLMAGLQALGHNRAMDLILYQLNHSPWVGLRFYDCIWPSFMLMTGVSISFSFAKRSQTQSYAQMFRHALKRLIVLFLLGSLRESVFLNAPYLLELSSALQPIAIASFVAFLLAGRSPRLQAGVMGGNWFAYALLLALVPAPGIPAGTYELNHNLVNYVDLVFLRDHWNVWPYAPEGWGTILSTIPTISTTILGLMLGDLLRSSRSTTSKIKLLAAVGAGGIFLGLAFSPWIPIVMKMWTTTYGILSAAWACLMFLVFYWVIDVRGWRRWSFFFVVIGMNALAVYLSASVTQLSRIAGIFANAAPLLGPATEFAHAVLLIAFEWAILYWMYRRKIFLSA